MPARSLDLNHDQDGKRNQTPQLNPSYHRYGSRQMFAVRTSCKAGYTSSLPRIFAVVPPPGPGGTRVGKSFRPLTRETVEESGVFAPDGNMKKLRIWAWWWRVSVSD